LTFGGIFLNFKDLILGYAIIENKNVTYCSDDIGRLLDDEGTHWITDSDKKELPFWIKLTSSINVKIDLLKDNFYVAIFLNNELIDELLEKNRDLTYIFNNSHDGIYVTDGAGNTLMISPGTERNFGLKSSDLIGKNVIDLEKEGVFRPSVARRVLEDRKRVTAYQETINGKHMIATGNPIFDDDGEIIRIIINSRDFTELSKLKKQVKVKEEEIKRYESELEQLRQKERRIDDFVARSEKMKNIISLVHRVSTVDTTILITGASGTGKSMLAKAIHNLSSRKDGPFITVNCSAIPESLLESEMFGYESGAFTGAKKEGKPGYFEIADKGTLFLDEISEIHPSIQAKLLQAVQEKTIQHVGGIQKIKVDFRLIAATNQDLSKMVERKQFREDLFYRLNVIPMEIPPLKERKEDIPLLIHFFLHKFNKRYQFNKHLGTDCINLLCHYDWPGNIRQLQNIIERLLILSRNDDIHKDDILQILNVSVDKNMKENINKVNQDDHLWLKSPTLTNEKKRDLQQILNEMEEKLIVEALKQFKTTRKAAKQLNISQSTLVRRLQKYNIKKA
jgi:PAS domain S-box-containing protein